MFRRILVANRGEIAVRIIRACHDLGIEAIAVASDADATAAHVRAADGSVRIGPPPPAASYLRMEEIVAAATSSGADAVHPGYGFLAERADAARAIVAAGLAFIGPSPEAIGRLGDKVAARRLATDVGVAVVPGSTVGIPLDGRRRTRALARTVAMAKEIGFPLLVKAAAGGGGRGMRRVTDRADLEAALVAGAAEAEAAFGDGTVYLEREIRPARHVEVQLLGEATGSVVAIGERDCSIQRRHQKLVEEAPAPGLSAGPRRELHEAAVRIGRAAGLTNAATAEFLLDRDGRFWFLEVNARLQVEHPVTELVSGLDLVVEQIRLAAGEPFGPAVERAAAAAGAPLGHAVEFRISAEDPARDFAPTPGVIGRLSWPTGPGVRVDAGYVAGDRVPPDYDPLIAKIVVHGPDRTAAIARARRALDEVDLGGIQTTLPFDRAVVRDAAFVAGDVSTDWVAERWDGPRARRAAAAIALSAALEAGSAGGGGGDSGSAELSRSRTDDHRGWRTAARREAIERWPR